MRRCGAGPIVCRLQPGRADVVGVFSGHSGRRCNFCDDSVAPISSASGEHVPLALSVIGVLALGFGGWLGGEMVYVKGMAVEAVEKLAKKE